MPMFVPSTYLDNLFSAIWRLSAISKNIMQWGHTYSLHTLRLISLRPLASVWGKTTLNTGGVGRARIDPQI